MWSRSHFECSGPAPADRLVLVDTASMEQLNTVLRRERRQLEVVVFKYAEVHLLLAAAELRFLTWSADRARHRLRETDLLRAANVQLLGLRGCRGNAPTLREVAGMTSDPWATILRDHHEGLSSLVSEVELLGHMNTQLAQAGMRVISEGRDPLSPGLASRHRRDASSPRATSAVLDEGRLCQPDLSLLEAETSYQDVLRSMNKLRMPSLLAFLR